MVANKVHKRQAMVGVAGGSAILAQRKPANPAVIILDKLAIGIHALFRCKHKVRIVQRLGHEMVVVSGRPMRPSPVGPVLRLKLQNAHIDPHLQHVPAVRTLHQAHHHLARAVRPGIEQFVEILSASSHSLISLNRARVLVLNYSRESREARSNCSVLGAGFIVRWHHFLQHWRLSTRGDEKVFPNGRIGQRAYVPRARCE